MNWYSDLYLGKTAREKKEKLIQKIESGQTPVNTYLLVLASGEDRQLEILPARNLKQLREPSQQPVILGLACGKDEAFELVRRITEEVYRETNTAGLKEYLGRKIQGKS